ncbi:OmpA family protein [Pseudomonas sp. RIT-To-2]|uniref:OmpA family protein n=1 Tax=Pseudomonas sp. RIT-To-2 TaxID=3462541 RepID=UPI002413845E
MSRPLEALGRLAVEGDEDSWMMTYLDMMTLLLVVTMAMLAISTRLHSTVPPPPPPSLPFMGQGLLPHGLALLGRPQVVKPVVATTAAVEPPAPTPPTPPAPPGPDELAKNLGLDALGKDIEVDISQKTVSFRLSSELLFESGQADLSLAGINALKPLLAVLGKNSQPILVQGHTDAEKIQNPRFPSNWELSSARAATVVRYLQANGVDGQRLRAVGFGDTHPLAGNESATGRAKNRRVEVVLEAVASPLPQ